MSAFTTRILTAIVILAAAVPLTWACVGQTMADLADSPQAAAAWSADSTQLARIAEAAFQQAKTPAQFTVATDLARRSLAAGPMESKALLVLGLDADRRGDAVRAARIMAVMNVRTRRDTQAQLWLFEHALARRDYPAAFTSVDILLRRRPELSQLLFAPVISALGDPAALAPLAAQLSPAHPPEWRAGFLSELAQRNPAVAADLLALLGGRSAPSQAETGALLAKLIADGDYRSAYRAWSKGLPPGAARGLLYDGGFAKAPGLPPFNWQTEDASGVVSELAASPDGRPALHVQYPASQNGDIAEQLLVLPPGAYRLTGEWLAGGGGAAAALAWRVSCAKDDKAVLAETRQAAGDGWRPFEAALTVPPTGCDAQWLRLANIAQDRFETVEAWSARMAIRPAP